MFHAWISNCDQLISVLIKRIFAEPMFKGFQHARHFLKGFHCSFFLMRQNPIIYIEFSAEAFKCFRPVYIVPDIRIYTIIVYWIGYFPVICLCFILDIVVYAF